MRLTMVSAVLSLAALVPTTHALARLPRCQGGSDQTVAQCQLLEPRPDRRSCPGTATLAQTLGTHGVRPGLPFDAIKRGATRLNEADGLGFRVVFRPTSRPERHGRLLETNPHARQDVTVCKTHEVVLYVGRYPFQHMPGRTLAHTTVADALRALEPTQTGLEPVFVDGIEVIDPDPQRLVTAQYPGASAPLGKRLPMLGFEMPAQRPVLLLAPTACPGPPPGECQPPVAVACPSAPPAVDPDADPSDTDAWLAGAGGLAGGLALARVLRSSGSAPVPPPPTPGRPTAPWPPTRVRRDVDPFTEPRESRRDDARA